MDWVKREYGLGKVESNEKLVNSDSMSVGKAIVTGLG